MSTSSKPSQPSPRRRSAFKEPTALKQLSRSLEAAQKALTELRKHAGRDAGNATKTLHEDLRKFLASAKRDTGKLTTALRRDFERAQKTIATASGSRSRTRRAAGRRTSGQSTARRGARKTS